MAQLYVAEVFDSLNRGTMTRAQARQTLLNVFQLLCWAYLTNAQRAFAVACLEKILPDDGVDFRVAEEDVAGLLQAMIMQDLVLFDMICERHHVGAH